MLAGNCTNESSTLATTAATEGDPCLLARPVGWVTSMPTIIVFFFVSHFIAWASSYNTLLGEFPIRGAVEMTYQVIHSAEFGVHFQCYV